MIYAIVYAVGVAFTVSYQVSTVDEEWDSETDPVGLLHLFWSCAVSLLWPAYWVGKAIMAPIERLMLPPGDTL